MVHLFLMAPFIINLIILLLLLLLLLLLFLVALQCTHGSHVNKLSPWWIMHSDKQYNGRQECDEACAVCASAAGLHCAPRQDTPPLSSVFFLSSV